MPPEKHRPENQWVMKSEAAAAGLDGGDNTSAVMGLMGSFTHPVGEGRYKLFGNNLHGL